jgi:aminoglycoside phosphotransferase (APT) family kinase protein
MSLANRRLLRLSDLVGRLHAAGQQTVDAGLPLWEQPPVAVHGDLRLENVLNSFGAPLLLDWEMFGLGDPALEVARFLHLHRQAIDPLLLDRWLDAYLDGLGDPAAPLRIEIYRHQLLPLQDAAYLLNGGVKLSAEERQSPELRTDAALLAATLHRALAQAGLALDAGDIQDDEDVAAECRALFSEETSL